jgi:GT2 family glycosyltransferase
VLANIDSLEFRLEEPIDGQVISSGGPISIRGWALADPGDLTIEVKVDSMDWIPVTHGKAGNDVAYAYPANPAAVNSGFGTRIDSRGLNVGEHFLVLRIRSQSSPPTEISRPFQIIPPSSREANTFTGTDFASMKLEEPSERAVTPRDSVLRISGWAVATSGIKSVDIWIDENGPFPSHYGLIREDIGARYDDLSEASHSGFLCAQPIGDLDPGLHRLRIVCSSESGVSATIDASFDISERSEYESWAGFNVIDEYDSIELLESTEALSYRPKISIVTPVYQTPLGFLKQCIDSVRRQVYPYWELILVDDCSQDSGLSAALEDFAREDYRIRVKALSQNLGIAGATNVGLQLCTGEYAGLLDHDDEIAPDALFQVVQALDRDRNLDVLYSDEDKIDANGRHTLGFFKPDWSPDLLLSMNYVCHFLVTRTSLLREVGGLRPTFDGSQSYDLILRLSERTKKIHRIPDVLYHERIHAWSTTGGFGEESLASEAGKRAIEEHLKAIGSRAEVLEIGPERYRTRYKIQDSLQVAIIIPTGGSPTLAAAIRSVLAESTYTNYELVIVDNSSGEGVKNLVASLQTPLRKITWLDYRGVAFNFSLLCNRGAEATSAPYLIFLNDDTSVITGDWIEAMLEHAQRPEIGTVGALLLFPNGTIQHAGVTVGLSGIAGHPFRGFPLEPPYYFDFTRVVRNCSAVTGACLMTRRDVFELVEGFDEPNLPTCFQDVDICLKMLEKGFRNVYTPFAKLFHFESFTKKVAAERPEPAYMSARWRGYIDDDPYYNPNQSRISYDYSLRFERSKRLGSHLKKSVPESGSTESAAQQTPESNPAKRARFYASESWEPQSSGPFQPITLTWETNITNKVQIRVGSPLGPLFLEGSSAGSATTGPWVLPGMAFFLVDAGQDDAISPDKILSVLTV